MYPKCQKYGFGGFWGWRCKNIVFWPPKGTTLREYASVGVSHVKIGSTAWALGPWKVFAYKERDKKIGGNFGYMRSNPWGGIDQIWHVVRYGGHNHVRNIWQLSVKGRGCSERGNFAFSHWLEVSPLQHRVIGYIVWHLKLRSPVTMPHRVELSPWAASTWWTLASLLAHRVYLKIFIHHIIVIVVSDKINT